MNLFNLGHFVLHAGKSSAWKIDCDYLTNGDLQTLAALITKLAGPFREVRGVPTGGLRLARYLEPYRQKDGPCLLVDDVLTTGSSMEAMRHTADKDLEVVGAVIFARGPCPSWVKAVFQVLEELW